MSAILKLTNYKTIISIKELIALVLKKNRQMEAKNLTNIILKTRIQYNGTPFNKFSQSNFMCANFLAKKQQVTIQTSSMVLLFTKMLVTFYW